MSNSIIVRKKNQIMFFFVNELYFRYVGVIIDSELRPIKYLTNPII